MIILLIIIALTVIDRRNTQTGIEIPQSHDVPVKTAGKFRKLEDALELIYEVFV